MTGFGKLCDDSGSNYVGWFKYDDRHGYGVYFDPNGLM